MYCRRPFIPSWATAVIVSLPGEGPREVRLSEDLEDRDIKAGGDDFQKEPVKKYSLLSDVQDGDGRGRGGGRDSPVLSCRRLSGQVLRSCVVTLIFIAIHLPALEKTPGVSKLARVTQDLAAPFLH